MKAYVLCYYTHTASNKLEPTFASQGRRPNDGGPFLWKCAPEMCGVNGFECRHAGCKNFHAVAKVLKTSNFYNYAQRIFTMPVLFTGVPGRRNFFAFFLISWVAQPSLTCKYGDIASSTKLPDGQNLKATGKVVERTKSGNIRITIPLGS